MVLVKRPAKLVPSLLLDSYLQTFQWNTFVGPFDVLLWGMIVICFAIAGLILWIFAVIPKPVRKIMNACLPISL